MRRLFPKRAESISAKMVMPFSVSPSRRSVTVSSNLRGLCNETLLAGDYSDEQRQHSGVSVYVDRNGGICIDGAYVRHEDAAAAIDANVLTGHAATAASRRDGCPKSPYSAALAENMHHARLCAVQAALPIVIGNDEALARRVVLIEFGEIIPESEIDVRLSAKLQSDAAGIFQAMLRGLADYRANGLMIPL